MRKGLLLLILSLVPFGCLARFLLAFLSRFRVLPFASLLLGASLRCGGRSGSLLFGLSDTSRRSGALRLLLTPLASLLLGARLDGRPLFFRLSDARRRNRALLLYGLPRPRGGCGSLPRRTLGFHSRRFRSRTLRSLLGLTRGDVLRRRGGLRSPRCRS